MQAVAERINLVLPREVQHRQQQEAEEGGNGEPGTEFGISDWANGREKHIHLAEDGVGFALQSLFLQRFSCQEEIYGVRDVFPGFL